MQHVSHHVSRVIDLGFRATVLMYLQDSFSRLGPAGIPVLPIQRISEKTQRIAEICSHHTKLAVLKEGVCSR